MAFNRTVDHGQNWSDPDNMPKGRAKLIEEQIAARVKRKRLDQCILPPNFRLVTPQPRQAWHKGQIKWVFALAWSSKGKDEFYSVHPYEQEVPDEIQIHWAVQDFGKELRNAGLLINNPQSLKERALLEFEALTAGLLQ